MNSSIWPIDGTLIAMNNLGQSKPSSNGNKGVLHIPQRLEPHHQMSLHVLLTVVIGEEEEEEEEEEDWGRS